jgi:hypothetical protein
MLRLKPIPGHREDAVLGLFYNPLKLLVIGEWFKDEHGWVKNEHHLQGTIGHEVGHAVDHHYKDISSKSNFVNAYAADYKVLSASERKQLGYYVQANTFAARQETFAELFSAIACGDSESRYFQDKFPNFARCMREFLVSEKLL